MTYQKCSLLPNINIKSQTRNEKWGPEVEDLLQLEAFINNNITQLLRAFYLMVVIFRVFNT